MNRNLIKFLLILLLTFNVLSIDAKNYIVFRIDDMGIDDFEIYYELLPIFEKYNIKLTIGVVPMALNNAIKTGKVSNEDIVFIKKYINKGIVEIAQHGYSHFANYKTNKITSEFFKQTYESQNKNINEGQYILEELFKVKINIFIPPWNAYDNNTLKALVDNGFSVVSAARYGAIAYGNKYINYIPYTITMNDFYKNLHTINKKIINDTNTDHVLVVMMHSYDFKFNNIGLKGDIDSMELESLLSFVSNQKKYCNVNFNELIISSLCFDNKKLQHSMYTKNKFSSYMILPDYILLSSFDYKPLNFLERNIFVIFASIYYLMVLFLGFGFGIFSKKKLFPKSNNVFYSIVISLIAIFLILFILKILGKTAIVAVLFLVGFFCSKFILKSHV